LSLSDLCSQFKASTSREPLRSSCPCRESSWVGNENQAAIGCEVNRLIRPPSGPPLSEGNLGKMFRLYASDNLSANKQRPAHADGTWRVILDVIDHPISLACTEVFPNLRRWNSSPSETRL